MNGRVRCWAFCAFLLLTPHAAGAQAVLQPTPAPTVTAENQGWYQRSEPITFAGNLYYPTGARTYFNRNEMVMSGFYGEVPLYTRTTIEPYSIVYVPLAGGLMQPYGRPRTGELAGTTGSTTSFPVGRMPAASNVAVLPQAAGPPVLLSPALSYAAPPAQEPARPAPAVAPTPAPSGVPQAVGTSGTVGAPRPAPKLRRQPSRLFIEFNNNRWFSAGIPVPFDSTRFVRVGEHRGFPVYAAKNGPASTIYVQLSGDLPDTVAPYTRRGR